MIWVKIIMSMKLCYDYSRILGHLVTMVTWVNDGVSELVTWSWSLGYTMVIHGCEVSSSTVGFGPWLFLERCHCADTSTIRKQVASASLVYMHGLCDWVFSSSEWLTSSGAWLREKDLSNQINLTDCAIIGENIMLRSVTHVIECSMPPLCNTEISPCKSGAPRKWPTPPRSPVAPTLPCSFFPPRELCSVMILFPSSIELNILSTTCRMWTLKIMLSRGVRNAVECSMPPSWIAQSRNMLMYGKRSYQ